MFHIKSSGFPKQTLRVKFWMPLSQKKSFHSLQQSQILHPEGTKAASLSSKNTRRNQGE